MNNWKLGLWNPLSVTNKCNPECFNKLQSGIIINYTLLIIDSAFYERSEWYHFSADPT